MTSDRCDHGVRVGEPCHKCYMDDMLASAWEGAAQDLTGTDLARLMNHVAEQQAVILDLVTEAGTGWVDPDWLKDRLVDVLLVECGWCVGTGVEPKDGTEWRDRSCSWCDGNGWRNRQNLKVVA